MADPLTISILVLAGCNLLASFLTPLVLAGSYLIKHITESNCWGSSLKVAHSTEHLEKHDESSVKANNDILLDIVHKLSLDKH
jgi:hypothetical protein